MKTSQQWIDNIKEKAIVRQQTIKKNRAVLGVSAGGAALSVFLVLALLFSSVFPSATNPIEVQFTDSENAEPDSKSGEAPDPASDTNKPASGVTRAVKLRTFLYSGSGLETSVGITGQSLNLRYLNLSDDYAALEGKNGPFVYDIKSGKVMSMTEVMQEKLTAAGALKTTGTFQLYNYDEDHVLYRTDSGSYYYCFSEKLPKKLPVELPGGSILGVSKDFRHYSVDKARPYNKNKLPVDDIYFVDILNGTAKCLTRDSAGKVVYEAFTAGGMFSSLSPTSRYVMFMVRGASDGENQPYVLYDTQADKGYLYKGYTTSFSENDEFMFFKNSGGGYKMECATGKITKLTKSDQPRHGITLNNFLCFDFSVPQEVYDLPQVWHQVSTIDLRTDKKTAVSELCSAFLIDDSKRYVYSYADKAKTVECFDLATNERYSLAVDDAFLKEVAANRGDWRYVLEYRLYLNDDGSELLLTYRVIPPSDPDGKNNTPGAAAGYFYRSNNNLDGFKEFVAPYGPLRLYAGNGFSYVEYESYDITYQMIEDYRSKRLITVSYDPSFRSLGFTFMMDSKPLSKGRTAQDFIKAIGQTPLPAEYDFTPYLRADGTFDSVAAFNLFHDPEKLKTIFTRIGIQVNVKPIMLADNYQPKNIAWVIDYFMKWELLYSHDEYNLHRDRPVPEAGGDSPWKTNEIYIINLYDNNANQQMCFKAGTLTNGSQKQYYLQVNGAFHCLVPESEMNRLWQFVKTIDS